jgi:CheY-like chemotaxis protein
MESADGTKAEGYILDLSQTGCRIQTPVSFEKSSRLLVSFRLPAGGEYNRIPLEVCRAESLENGTYLGCIFEESAAGALTELQVYIAATLEGGGRTQNSASRVMIFDPNVSRSQSIGAVLENRDVNVVYAKNLIEGAYSLRVLPPNMILASTDQTGISGLSLLGMLRTLPTCEFLPLLIYGDTEAPEFFREAAENMITLLPSDATPKAIASECLRHLGDRLKAQT